MSILKRNLSDGFPHWMVQTHSVDLCFTLPESAMAFPQMPRARIPKIKEGSGIDVTLLNSIGVLTIKLPLASKIWSNIMFA